MDTAAALRELEEPVRRYFAHALPAGAPPADCFRLSMSGRIKLGLWLPFTAAQELTREAFTWRARVGLGPLTLFRAVDQFANGRGAMDVRLFGKLGVVHADDANVVRSAAGRAALEAATFAPATLLGAREVSWRAESDDHIVASWAVGPEQPEVNIRIGGAGEVQSSYALRWGRAGTDDFQYIPCGCRVLAERRFGDYVVPSEVRVSWWFGTAREIPFFEAQITAHRLVSVRGARP